MSDIKCQSCLTAKTDLSCDSCNDPLCKKCSHFLEPDTFKYLQIVPKDLTFSRYCNTCNELHIVPALEAYNKTLQQAKEIAVYNNTQGKETRLMRRGDLVFKVENCTDEQDATMRLAFMAVEGGFNAIIDVDISGKKVRSEAYQTMTWSGTAVPTVIKDRHIIKDRSFWSTPN